MSNQKVTGITLSGFTHGPYFPEALVRIHSSVYKHPRVRGFTRGVIRNLCKNLFQKFGVGLYPVTSDRHMWYCYVQVESEYNTYALLLPLAHDKDHSDGTESNRHSCVYAKQPSDNIEADKLFKPLVNAICDWALSNRKY